SDGRWTRECRLIFPDATYFLADPLPENEASLRALRSRNPNVTIWRGAIGASTSTMELYCHGDQSSFLASRDAESVRHSVPVRTLDSFLNFGTFGSPMLLKADVQGYEIEVLKGAEQCLQRTEMLLLETSIHRLYE